MLRPWMEIWITGRLEMERLPCIARYEGPCIEGHGLHSSWRCERFAKSFANAHGNSTKYDKEGPVAVSCAAEYHQVFRDPELRGGEAWRLLRQLHGFEAREVHDGEDTLAVDA